jgi:hypothetical protein
VVSTYLKDVRIGISISAAKQHIRERNVQQIKKDDFSIKELNICFTVQ